MLRALLVCVLVHAACGRTPDEQVVFDHVANNVNLTFRSPSGQLKYPYLVPAGPYDELWDWDSVLLGVATLRFGSAPYLAGSMKNFLSLTNLTTGEVAGALTPTGPVPAVYHAKPIVVQGAWLVAKYQNDYEQFFAFQQQMEALLAYWDTTRFHNESGLYVWFDQMETGCDNLVTSFCPNWMSLQCWTSSQALSLSATDLMVWMAREHHAYANFLQVWSKLGLIRPSESEVFRHMERSKAIVSSMDAYLWNESLGYYLAFNTTSNSSITNRVFYMAWPVFGGLLDADQAQRATEALTQADMLTEFGIRSTSALDPRYTNVNEIFPYSNWRGPIWVLVNALLAYGYNDLAALYPTASVAVGRSVMSYSSLARDLATRIVGTLAADLNATQTWHECYSSDSGAGLAAPGFLSFNTLGATLLENLGSNVNPFSL